MDTRLLNTFLALTILFGGANSQVTLEFKSAGGSVVTNAVEENTELSLECSYNLGSDNQAPQIKVISFDAAGLAVTERTCAMFPSGDPIIGSSDDSRIDDSAVTDTHCDRSRFSITIRFEERLPYRYQCVTSTVTDSNKVESAVEEMRTFATPRILTFGQVPSGTPKEGDNLEFTCQATARPTAKLRFVIDGVPVSGGVSSHIPSLDSITVDSPTSSSSLQWGTQASASLNLKQIECRVFDHLSGIESSDSRVVYVYYGPQSEGLESLAWNLEGNQNFELPCNLSSNPAPTAVRWYNDTDSSDVRLISELNTLTLEKSAYSYVTRNGPAYIQTYRCVAQNQLNNNKNGSKTFSLEIITTEKLPTSTDGPTSAGLRDWQLGLIIAAAVIVLLIIIIIVVVVIKRQRSPHKKKAAAAKSVSDNTMSYRSNNQGQPDIIRNSGYQPSTPTPDPTAPSYLYAGMGDQPDMIDDKPRSRKPVVLDELSLDALEPGPPGYQDVNYRDYTPQGSYNTGYGAPC